MRSLICLLVVVQVLYLVESRVNFNTIKSKVVRQDIDGLKGYLQNGESANMIGPICNKSLLMWAAMSGADEAARVLLQNNADPNVVEQRTGMTALMYATKNKNKEVMKVLMEYNADKMKRDANGKTAMDMAKEYGFYDELVEVF